MVQEARLLAGMGTGEGVVAVPGRFSRLASGQTSESVALMLGQPGMGYAAASSLAGTAAGWALVMKSTAFWAAPAASTTARRSCLMIALQPSR